MTVAIEQEERMKSREMSLAVVSITEILAIEQEERMKSREEVMNMLEAFDVTGSFRDVGELAGVSHRTVARYVAKRDAGALAGGGSRRRERIIDPWMPKIEEWVERSHAKIRADRAFDKLKALGFEGSERTVRRAVAEVKANHCRGRWRVYRPWIPEPGMWAQWDWGAGPVIAGRRTNLFCAWLAWSRFRVVIATWDRTLATVISCVDRAMRAFGGAATYWLTDNERTVTIDHVAGVAVRHLEMVAAGGHYGITVATCVPADPESKGGSEATVRVAKADLVPTDANLRGDYTSWAELAEACEALTALHGQMRVDWALGHAATYARFAEGDVASILAAHPVGECRSADEDHSLQSGTRAWEGFGDNR